MTVSDMCDQEANRATGDHPARRGQPVTRAPAGWNSKHPHDIKVPFGPSADDTRDEVERDEDQQRAADSKTRETADEQRKRKVVRVTVGGVSEDIDAEIAPMIQAMWEADIETAATDLC